MILGVSDRGRSRISVHTDLMGVVDMLDADEVLRVLAVMFWPGELETLDFGVMSVMSRFV